MIETIEKAADKVFVPLTVGGGIRKIDDIRSLLLAGADKVSINTAAVNDPMLVIDAAKKFGSQCIVVAVDIKMSAQDKWQVFTHGGRKATGLDAIEWIKKMQDYGVGEILLTSMDKDGTKEGYDINALKKIDEWLKIPIIASGGAGRLEHIRDAFLLGLSLIHI